jgi:hypothetical protein
MENQDDEGETVFSKINIINLGTDVGFDIYYDFVALRSF